MLAKSLKDTLFFQLLESRKSLDNNAKAYAGLLLLTEPDAEETLEFIKKIFPGYTSHNMGHSLRILECLYQALSDALRKELSSAEIFCLIMAAMFHDMGMAESDMLDLSGQRDQHHLYAEKPLRMFMEEKMTVIKEWRRLLHCILFVCQAHGMELEAFYGHKDFYTKDTISGDPLRFGLLGVLLRIGDLLDLDENRTSVFVRKYCASYFQDETSKRHHSRHEHIERFSISPQEIDISVLAAHAEEYHIWDRWLHYLKEDILHANTYLMPKLGSGLNLPELKSEIQKAANANFETEELRFELTEEGKIWSILSQSVYTEEFDFIRELVQNGIDAVLMKNYQETALTLEHPSPRSWEMWDRNGKVVVAYSAERKLLMVWDLGIGMDSDEVRRFLFRITDSGYQHKPSVRPFPFYAISKFGIGFISCLSKCEEILLYTYPTSARAGCKVRMYSNSTHAYFEKLEAQPNNCGTTICMQLKRSYKAKEVQDYLEKTFRYPSVPVEWLDLDQMEREINALNDIKRLKHSLTIESCNQMSQHQFERDYDYFEVVRDSVFKEHMEEVEAVARLNSKLKTHLEMWHSLDISGMLQQKAFEQKISLLLRDMQQLDKYTDVRQQMGQLLTESKKMNAEEFSNMFSTLLYKIQDCSDRLVAIEQQLKAAANAFMNPRWQVGNSRIFRLLNFNACLIPLQGDFSTHTIITDKTRGQHYLQGTGIFFVHCAFNDWDLGVEWRSVHGFLFQNRELKVQLIELGEKERSFIEESCGMDLSDMMDPDYFELYDSPEVLLNDCLRERNYQLGEEIVMFIHCLEVKREKIVRQQTKRVERRDVYNRWHLDQDVEDLGEQDFIGAIMQNLNPDAIPEVMEIDSLSQTKSCIYQDGMPLDVDPTGLMPLGMCRVRANLSGRARMELNVTRRHVDETQAKIDAWLADVGIHIQRRVLEQLNRAIREWGFQEGLQSLHTEIEGNQSNNYFERRCWQQLFAICSDNSASSSKSSI